MDISKIRIIMETKSGGISILGLLGIVFIVLKLCKVIDWSWWWVTSPFWGMAAIAVLVFMAVCVMYIIKQINK